MSRLKRLVGDAPRGLPLPLDHYLVDGEPDPLGDAFHQTADLRRLYVTYANALRVPSRDSAVIVPLSEHPRVHRSAALLAPHL